MKITLFATVAGMGGMQMNGRGMAKSFLMAGHEVQIISSVLNKDFAGEVKADENNELIKLGAKIVYLPDQKSTLQRCMEFLRLMTEVKKFRPDMLIGMGTSRHLGILGMVLPNNMRKVFYEGMSGESDGVKDPRWLVRWFFNEVIGQSPRVMETFARSFGWKKRLAVIPAFPEPLELTAKLPQVQSHAIPFGKARAALFSRLVEGKQALWLVKQWPALKELIAILHIHGRGPEQPAIEKLITEHGLQDRVCCYGAYPSGQPYVDLLGTYDLTLLPTTFPEGAPLVLLESMACGIPFVANGMGGIPDYVTNNPDCIVVPKQAAFIDGVRQMVEALANGKINQSRLQKYYLVNYTQVAIEKQWLDYLAG